MKTTQCTSGRTVFLLLASMITMVAQSPAQIVATPLEELSVDADLIVIAKVTNLRAEWNGDRTRIFTKVSLDVGEYLKGQALGPTMVLTVAGGEVDAVGEYYSNAPNFDTGEEVLVFVKRDAKDNLLVAGGAKGKFTITEDTVTGEKRIHKGLSLSQFASKVKKLTEQKMR